jgi:hypothetical protein
MWKRVLISILLVVFLIIGLLVWDAGRSVRADRLTIAAIRIKKAPTGLDDPIWLKTGEVGVPVKGRDILADEEGIVKIRALYTDRDIYFRLNWDDPTRSVTKQSWIFDGKTWRHLEGNEDRIALVFEITRIKNFATRGCAVTCHSPADVSKDEWKFATRTAAEKSDLWHWKAARSDPHNHADDAWLTVAGNPTGSYRETGRRKDTGAGGDVKNQTADKSKPLYMQDPKKTPSVPGFLLSEEAVQISDYSIFKAGDVIPFRLPRKPSGSRFDVKALSRYTSESWTVMLYRKLDTGHEDDVIFNPLKRYSFAVAVFDDSGGDHSKATLPLTLEFNR